MAVEIGLPEMAVISMRKPRRQGMRSELWVFDASRPGLDKHAWKCCAKEHQRGIRFQLYPEEALPEALRSWRMLQKSQTALRHLGVRILRGDDLIPVPPVRGGDRVVSFLEFRSDVVTFASIIEGERTKGGISPLLRNVVTAVARGLATLHKRRCFPRDRATGRLTSKPEKLQEVYNLHFQTVLERLQDNFIGPAGLLMKLETFGTIERLINRNIARLVGQRFRVAPRRGHGDCNPWNLHIPKEQLLGPASQVELVSLDFDNSEFLDPASDLADLAAQWDAAYFESGGDSFYLKLWQCLFEDYRRFRPDQTIECGMPPNYGCKGTTLLNPDIMGTRRVAKYRREFTRHLMRVLERGRYFPPCR